MQAPQVSSTTLVWSALLAMELKVVKTSVTLLELTQVCPMTDRVVNWSLSYWYILWVGYMNVVMMMRLGLPSVIGVPPTLVSVETALIRTLQPHTQLWHTLC